MCRWDGGGQDPKRERAVGLNTRIFSEMCRWDGGDEIPRDLARGGDITRGRNPWDTGMRLLVHIEITRQQSACVLYGGSEVLGSFKSSSLPKAEYFVGF